MNNSKAVILAVVGFLGLIGLATVTGGFVLAYQGTAIPGELIAIGSGAVGAIAGILAKTTTEPAAAVAAEPAPLEPPAAPAPAPTDFSPQREKLAGAAAALLDVAHALEDPPPPADAQPNEGGPLVADPAPPAEDIAP